MIRHGLYAFQVLALLCTPSSAGSDTKAKAPEDPITVQSTRGELMNGVILTTASLEKAKAELEHTIEALQAKAMEDIKAKAAAVSKRTEETRARFEAAKEIASKRLAEQAQLVEKRWKRISVQSFHNRLGKCCCRHIDPGAPATPDCHWEAYDKGGPYVDFACHDGYKDYLEAFPAEEMAGERRFLASSADALLDQCSESEGWSFKDTEKKAEPSTKRSMDPSVAVTKVEVPAGIQGGNLRPTEEPRPPPQPQPPPPKEYVDPEVTKALDELQKGGSISTPSIVPAVKADPAQQDNRGLFQPNLFTALQRDEAMIGPSKVPTGTAAPHDEDMRDLFPPEAFERVRDIGAIPNMVNKLLASGPVHDMLRNAPPEVNELLASGPVQDMLRNGEAQPKLVRF